MRKLRSLPHLRKTLTPLGDRKTVVRLERTHQHHAMGSPILFDGPLPGQRINLSGAPRTTQQAPLPSLAWWGGSTGPKEGTLEHCTQALTALGIANSVAEVAGVNGQPNRTFVKVLPEGEHSLNRLVRGLGKLHPLLTLGYSPELLNEYQAKALYHPDYTAIVLSEEHLASGDPTEPLAAHEIFHAAMHLLRARVTPYAGFARGELPGDARYSGYGGFQSFDEPAAYRLQLKTDLRRELLRAREGSDPIPDFLAVRSGLGVVAQNIAMAREALAALDAGGIPEIITTPHGVVGTLHLISPTRSGTAGYTVAIPLAKAKSTAARSTHLEAFRDQLRWLEAASVARQTMFEWAREIEPEWDRLAALRDPATRQRSQADFLHAMIHVLARRPLDAKPNEVAPTLAELHAEFASLRSAS